MRKYLSKQDSIKVKNIIEIHKFKDLQEYNNQNYGEWLKTYFWDYRDCVEEHISKKIGSFEKAIVQKIETKTNKDRLYAHTIYSSKDKISFFQRLAPKSNFWNSLRLTDRNIIYLGKIKSFVSFLDHVNKTNGLLHNPSPNIRWRNNIEHFKYLSKEGYSPRPLFELNNNKYYPMLLIEAVMDSKDIAKNCWENYLEVHENEQKLVSLGKQLGVFIRNITKFCLIVDLHMKNIVKSDKNKMYLVDGDMTHIGKNSDKDLKKIELFYFIMKIAGNEAKLINKNKCTETQCLFAIENFMKGFGEGGKYTKKDFAFKPSEIALKFGLLHPVITNLKHTDYTITVPSTIKLIKKALNTLS